MWWAWMYIHHALWSNDGIIVFLLRSSLSLFKSLCLWEYHIYSEEWGSCWAPNSTFKIIWQRKPKIRSLYYFQSWSEEPCITPSVWRSVYRYIVQEWLLSIMSQYFSLFSFFVKSTFSDNGTGFGAKIRCFTIIWPMTSISWFEDPCITIFTQFTAFVWAQHYEHFNSPKQKVNPPSL